MNPTLGLIAIIGFILGTYALLGVLCLNPSLTRTTKLTATFFVVLLSWPLISIVLNIKNHLLLEPLNPPPLERGAKIEEDNTALYLYIILGNKVDISSFYTAAYKLIEQPGIILPINNPDTLLSNGQLGQALPKKYHRAYTMPIGNLKEQIKAQVDQIHKEMRSENTKTNAKARTYMLLALANRYILTEKLIECLTGQYILEETLNILEIYPEINNNSYIQKELRIALGLPRHILVARAREAQIALALLEESLPEQNKSSPYTVSRGLLRKFYNIRSSELDLAEESTQINSLKTQALLGLQFPTLKLLDMLGINDLTHPEVSGATNLSKRAGMLCQ